MTVSLRDRQTVRLLPHLMAMKQSTDMTLFTVTQWALEERDPNRPEDGIMMTVVLKRKISKEIVTTYVPTALLMMITLATIFIKPFYFEAALGTNLTTMLMMTTIFMTVTFNNCNFTIVFRFYSFNGKNVEKTFCEIEVKVKE